MQYRILGKTGIRVSEISFGCWAIGGQSEAAGVQWGWGQVPERDAITALHCARESGVNFYDTADVYGNGRSEAMLAKAFASNWNGISVASKVGNVVRDGSGAKDWSRQHIIRSCEGSLHRLKKDALDLYQLHNPDIETIRAGDWPDTMAELQRQGKIRFYGVSLDTPEEAIALMERGAGHTIQLVYNALRQEMADDVFPMAMDRNYGILARVPLYYGILAGKYTAETTFPADDHRSHTLPPETMRQLAPRAACVAGLAGVAPGADFARWALKFALSHKAVSCAIPGARNPRQAEANCAASDGISLRKEQIAAVRYFWEQDAYLRQLRTPL